MIVGATLARFKPLVWLLPGFLLWAAFPPMAEITDALFALAPLVWLARQGNARRSARRWFLSGAFYWVATLSWMPAIVKNGGPWPLVGLGWFALAAYCAAYFAAFGYLSGAYWGWAKGRHYAWRLFGILVFEPVVWMGLELVRSRFLGGFAWNQLGVIAANAGFGAPAAWGGVYLLSGVILLVNGSIAGIAERVVANVRARRGMTYDAGALGRMRSIETLLVFLILWGVYAGVGKNACGSGAEMLKVALVQRNFPCCFQGRDENPYAAYQPLLANIAPLKPELVVCAESALSEFGAIGSVGARRFARWASAQTGGAALIAGGTRAAERRVYNSAALYSTQDPAAPNAFASAQTYDKVHLVPFGEYIPGDKIIPALQRLAPVGSCTAGEPKLLVGPRDIPLGVAICYEDTDSALVRTFAKMGAQALVFITNDSWFSHSVEAEQHAWQAVARAVETGLPVLRVGNSGVSGFITPTGKTTWMLGANGKPLVDEAGTIFDKVALNGARKLTFYARFGDFPLFIAFTLVCLGIFMVKYALYFKRRF